MRCTRMGTLAWNVSRSQCLLVALTAVLGVYLGGDWLLVPEVSLVANYTENLTMSGKWIAPAMIPETDIAPPLPTQILALLREDWAPLDPQGPEMVASVKAIDALSQFPHARDTFGAHLIGTFGLLAMWGQPADVRRCGLFHTAYSGDLFRFFVYDAENGAHRKELSGLIGAEGEALTWLFGTVHRGALLGLKDMISDDAPPVYTLAQLGDEAITVAHRLAGHVNVTRSEVAKLMVVTMADYLEQLVEVNGWRDLHQHESPSVLWPGDGRPGIGLHWLSSMCVAIREHLEAVPPPFGKCTQILSRADEMTARDAYWRVVTEEATLTEHEQATLLEGAVMHNPHVGEPDVYLAQLHFRNGRFDQALTHCARALHKFYALGARRTPRAHSASRPAPMVRWSSNRRRLARAALARAALARAAGTEPPIPLPTRSCRHSLGQASHLRIVGWLRPFALCALHSQASWSPRLPPARDASATHLDWPHIGLRSQARRVDALSIAAVPWLRWAVGHPGHAHAAA